jgi:hypothetical protein
MPNKYSMHLTDEEGAILEGKRGEMQYEHI